MYMYRQLLHTLEIKNDTFLVNIFEVMAIVPYWEFLADIFI